MRRSKEIMILLALLLGAMAFVLWYVIDRRAKNRAAPPVATRNLAPEPPTANPASNDITLNDATERKTIDFSSGQPVIKDTAEDQAALAAALKDMNAAAAEVTFDPSKKDPPPKP